MEKISHKIPKIRSLISPRIDPEIWTEIEPVIPPQIEPKTEAVHVPEIPLPPWLNAELQKPPCGTYGNGAPAPMSDWVLIISEEEPGMGIAYYHHSAKEWHGGFSQVKFWMPIPPWRLKEPV